MKYKNPVLRGMYPDPSACRVGNKYYMVCSSFQYFPAVPLFESSDMVNWRQIGHCLTRKSQVDLRGTDSCSGIFAPTIRFHKGRFYMVTTNATTKRNFYVYTDNIYDEWSEPIEVEQEGIDPSFYFEEDRAYFLSNGYDELGISSFIQICEIDIATGKKLSETKPLWHGTGGRFIEAPHLYKIGKYYYLLDAEGGTEYGHMANYARSSSLWGPFEPFKGNPVLTNRNLGGYILQGAGHGELIEGENGQWWFMHLAFRQAGQWVAYHHLGRECCLVPVKWENDWFYMGDGTARLVYNVPELKCEMQQLSFKKTFSNLDKNKDWCFLRTCLKENYEFGKDYLKLTGTTDTLFNGGCPTFAAIRQSEFEMVISCTLKSKCIEAGITLFADEKHHYDIYLDHEQNVVLRLTIGCVSQKVKVIPVEEEEVQLIIRADAYGYTFQVVSQNVAVNMGNADTRYLSSEVAGGFTGVMIGLYAVDDTERQAVFTQLNIEHIEE